MFLKQHELATCSGNSPLPDHPEAMEWSAESVETDPPLPVHQSVSTFAGPWQDFQAALEILKNLREQDMTQPQISALAAAAQNMVGLAKTGRKQPELYRLVRHKSRKVLEKKGWCISIAKQINI